MTPGPTCSLPEVNRKRQRRYETSDKGRATTAARSRRHRATNLRYVLTQRRSRIRRLREQYTKQLEELNRESS